MIEPAKKNWRVSLGVASPVILFPLSIKDRGGLEFKTALPGQRPTGAKQEGVNLIFETVIRSPDPQSALEKIDPIIERLLNAICFRLMADINPIALEIVEDTSTKIQRDFVFLPKYSPLDQGRFQYLGYQCQGGIPNESEIFNDDSVDAAIRWLLHGLRGRGPVESFAGYWLAIENLAPKGAHAHLLMRCCDRIIEKCPFCKASTLGSVGQKQRLQQFFVLLGKDDQYFKNVWALRNSVFHGSSEVFRRMMDIATESVELRRIAIEVIKKAQGIPESFPPIQQSNGTVLAKMGVFGHYLPDNAEG